MSILKKSQTKKRLNQAERELELVLQHNQRLREALNHAKTTLNTALALVAFDFGEKTDKGYKVTLKKETPKNFAHGSVTAYDLNGDIVIEYTEATDESSEN